MDPSYKLHLFYLVKLWLGSDQGTKYVLYVTLQVLTSTTTTTTTEPRSPDYIRVRNGGVQQTISIFCAGFQHFELQALSLNLSLPLLESSI